MRLTLLSKGADGAASRLVHLDLPFADERLLCDARGRRPLIHHDHAQATTPTDTEGSRIQ